MNDTQYSSLMNSMHKLIVKQNEILATLNETNKYLEKLSKKTLIVDNTTQELYKLKTQVQALIDEASM